VIEEVKKNSLPLLKINIKSMRSSRSRLIKIKNIFVVSFLMFFASAKIVFAVGTLSGYAWSENMGWINFAPTGGGVSVNNTGEMYGYAWGENMGWISFNCVDATSCASSDYKVKISPFYASSGGGGGGCPTCPVCASDNVAPKISNVEISEITSKSAVVRWETDEAADSSVQYGTDGKYTLMAGNPSDITSPQTKHEILMLNLNPETDYELKVISRDAAGNSSVGDSVSFKTLALTEIEKMQDGDKLNLTIEILKELYDKGIIDDAMLKEIIEKTGSQPTILGEDTMIKNLTSQSATISWQTDKKTNSFVRFRKAGNDTLSWEEVGVTSDYITDHLVTIDGLEADTAYEYQAKSMDILGNIALSKINSFTTRPKAVISEVTVSGITLDSAVVSWKTNIPNTSDIDYGFSTNYDKNYESNSGDRVMTHEVKLKNLENGKIYHYKVKGRDENGDLVSSDDYVFNTYAMPVISNYDLAEVKDYSASIKWTSNIEMDSTVTYTDVKTSESRMQGDAKFVLDHKIDLTNLNPGTEYVIKIEGRDIFGNIAKSSDIKIVTLLDNVPPQIDSIRTDVSLSSSSTNKTQLVIVWKTDEPATSQVMLYENGNEQKPSNSSSFDSNLTTKHTTVFTNLGAGMVYRLQIESADKSGNLTKSRDFVVLTPQNRKSILQIIIDIIQKMFGWVNNI